MRRRTNRISGRAALVAAVIGVMTAAHLMAQGAAPAPASPSATRVKDLIAALQGKQLESFAVTDSGVPGRYVAVLHQPGIQILVVSAAYERSTDMDYRFYQKDYMNAYLDLRTGVLSKDRLIIEDAGANGLVALPGKNPVHDSVMQGTAEVTFDGTFADPKKKDQKKLSQADYMKRFTDAEEQYARLLGVLIEALKK